MSARKLNWEMLLKEIGFKYMYLGAKSHWVQECVLKGENGRGRGTVDKINLF